jgi:hypothetical protein
MNYCPRQFTWRLHSWLGSLRFGLCNRTAKQVFIGQKHSVRRCSLHCYRCTLLILCINGCCFDSNTEQSTCRACHTNFPPSWLTTLRCQVKLCGQCIYLIRRFEVTAGRKALRKNNLVWKCGTALYISYCNGMEILCRHTIVHKNNINNN